MRPEWQKVTRKPIPGRSNVTFIKVLTYLTDGGRFAARVYEGFGVQEDDPSRPVLLVHGTPRYFKTEAKRTTYITRQLEYWGIKK